MAMDSTEQLESEDKGGAITEPLDPTQVRIETRSLSVDQLVKRLRQQEIDLGSTRPQHGTSPWNDADQSRLIESLLIRMPLPAFYLDATDEDRWLVVDGPNRLRVFQRFIVDGELRLGGLEFLTQYNGKSFSELPRPMQRRIEETQLTVHLIQPGTPPELRFNLFKRINTGSLPLSAQEIRHALNPGPAADLLEALAAREEFQRVTGGAIRKERMADRECVLRFLAFVLTPPDAYAAQDLDAFLNAQMKALNERSDDERHALESRFLRAINAAWELFGPDAFRRPAMSTSASTPTSTPRNPINAPLFETWSVSLDALSDEELAQLISRKDRLHSAFITRLNGDTGLATAISNQTGDVQKVKLRFAEIRGAIREVLDAAGTETS